jgi:hypothetical protein
MLDRSHRRMRLSLRWLSFVCLLMLGFSTVVEAGHFHSAQSQESAKTCPLCVSAHSSGAVLSARIPVVLPLAAVAPLLLPRVFLPLSRLEKGPVFVRPPPAV